MWDWKHDEKSKYDKEIFQTFIVTLWIVKNKKGENFGGDGRLVFQEKVIAKWSEMIGKEVFEWCDNEILYPTEAIHQRKKVCCIAVITV